MRLRAGLDFDTTVAVAVLGWDAGARQAAAQWDDGFRANPLPVSPLLLRPDAPLTGLLRPRGRGFGDLPGLFGDSLPDGWGRLLIDRDLAARGRARHDITDLDRLAMIGRDGMGALSYAPETPGKDGDISLDWFDRLVPEIGGDTAADDLERLRRMAGGSQGARPKFVAQLSDDNGHLRGHRLAHAPGWRHVLVKRRALSDPVGAIEAELAFAVMARAAGIDMPDTAILRASSAEPFLVSTRFDRQGPARRHMQTVAALLDVDFRSATLDYDQLLRITKLLTRDQRAVEQMALRMVFNARAHNRDDHLKNHAFLMEPRGEWRLSPAYDLSFSSGPGGEHTLTIAGEGRRPGAADFVRAAQSAGIRPARMRQMTAAVDDALADWPRQADRAGVPAPLRHEIGQAIQTARGW
ncbi:type II toxin-antitoxin system HipA family toxin [Paracoccus sp. (in: a-proteobacteria)]|uniref:type II toxin-antitoxin system HipA family toxin n=1 Tax=Paracoccus sp. TaxID=267 RepID=UPI0026DECD57|nr:type II toxin-antitoxin system HipA family toxin [Paracoccus sp. (in: a-proteobacteria)]MDO5648697.1 type II toxin-antitoxin system HipA family toxin [Paracoccus sp. (in: a-proteobacteria)]